MSEAPLILVVRWEDFADLTEIEIEAAWSALGKFVRLRALAARRRQQQEDAQEAKVSEA